MKQQFLKEKTDTIRLTVYIDNRPIVPTSAKVTLYHPSGSTLQAQATATVDGTSGEMTYSITATHTATHRLNYKAIWEYVYNGTTYYETQLFDVVKSILSIPITDDDIFAELDVLRKANTQVTATATAGAAGSITDTKRKENDDYWTGGVIHLLSGTGSGQKRVVSDFVQSTGVISVTPNWTTTPDNTSVYRLIKSFTTKIEQCFKKIETMIYNKGRRHSLILESSQVEMPLTYLTVHSICLDLISEEGDKWHVLADAYEKKFEKAFNTMKVDYDSDESGGITDEENQNISEFGVGRS